MKDLNLRGRTRDPTVRDPPLALFLSHLLGALKYFTMYLKA